MTCLLAPVTNFLALAKGFHVFPRFPSGVFCSDRLVTCISGPRSDWLIFFLATVIEFLLVFGST